MGGVHSVSQQSDPEKLMVMGTKTDGSAMTAIKGQAAWDTLAKKPAKINPPFLEEILFRPEELIFATA